MVDGEKVIKIIGGRGNKGTQYIDETLINQFKLLPYVKTAVIILLILIMIILILRIFNIKSLLKAKGVSKEISNINELKSRDKYIIKSNKLLKRITTIVQSTPFNVPMTSREYTQYNLNRAGVKIVGGTRYITSEEFNAISKIILAIIIAVAVVIAILQNMILGIVIILSAIVCEATIPMIVIRSIVTDKDREIKENFTDLYLMLHYVLMTGAGTPTERIMRSYEKTTSSNEMKRFIDNCIGHIETHGEYTATRLIAKDYREIHEVGKLMRLIRQLHDGGEIKQELLGFREELIKNIKYNKEKRMNKLIAKARLSFKVLTIVLIQAVVSAMAVYLPDLQLMKGIFGL